MIAHHAQLSWWWLRQNTMAFFRLLGLSHRLFLYCQQVVRGTSEGYRLGSFSFVHCFSVRGEHLSALLIIIKNYVNLRITSFSFLFVKSHNQQLLRRLFHTILLTPKKCSTAIAFSQTKHHATATTIYCELSDPVRLRII